MQGQDPPPPGGARAGGHEEGVNDADPEDDGDIDGWGVQEEDANPEDSDEGVAPYAPADNLVRVPGPCGGRTYMLNTGEYVFGGYQCSQRYVTSCFMDPAFNVNSK